MTTNTKIRTEDVLEILDIKIKTSADHAQLDVITGESYDSVLAKIAARSPTLDEKDALDNATSPSAINPYVTLSELTASLSGAIPWRTIGPVGSGADYEGADETPFLTAFASANMWFYVKPGTYTFTVPVTIPSGVRLVGGLTSTTILSSSLGSVLTLSDDAYVGFLSVVSSLPGATAITASSTARIELKNCIVEATPTGITVDVTGASRLSMLDTALLYGNLSGIGLTDSTLAGLYVDASGTYGIDLDSPVDVIIWGSIFYAGVPRVVSGTNIRIIGNHFGSGVTNTTPISSVLLRANTPSSNNNEDESLTYLLQYLGSPGALQATPSYSSNFAGPQAQDLTARASAIDLLLQWIYEERNFSLIAETEPMVVTWNPTTATLSTSGGMLLVSAHRDAVWKLPTVAPVNIPDGSYLYYVIDRTLATADITLTQYIAPLGSLPIDPNPPTGSPDNRQIWTLAYNLGGTLWWRGGGGSRFPATGGYTGEYFVDGTSKSFLTYVGANDYNDPHPLYTNNFAGIQGESLTTRLGKTDTLIKRLFEHTNLGYYISSGGYLSSDAVGTLILTGTLTFKLPHVAGSITVAPQTFPVVADGSLLYFTWDQVALGAATATVATTVPLPDAYPPTTKYFVAAIRVGANFHLWDGSRIPMTGGRWPLPSPNRSVVLSSPATVLPGLGYQVINNTVWTTISGTKHFLWENLAVTTATGIALNRNTLVNQTIPSVGLTDLADGEGLVVTHTWNPGSAQNATISKVSLPLSFILEQNQFLWVQNRGGYLQFTGEV
jgi:hypothetical protein